jgi:aspartate carbamoyltransferase catalytic subunit
VEIAPDVADGLAGHPSAIETQVRNGVAVRMACLYLLMGSAAGEVL